MKIKPVDAFVTVLAILAFILWVVCVVYLER